MSIKSICFTIGNMESGGAERVIANLSNNFVQKGYKIDIIAISTNKTDSFYKLDQRIQLHTLYTDERVKKFFSRVKRLENILSKIKPDVIISFLPHVNVYTHFANRKLKIKHIVSERNNPYINPKNKFFRILKKYVFFKADGCVFQTNDSLNYYGRKVKHKSAVIFNPVNISAILNDNIKRSKKIVAVGRLEEQKNYPLLINAFNDFLKTERGYKLHIYGDGCLKNSLLKLTKDLGLLDSIIFKGRVKNLHDEIHDAKMYIMTSNYEGMPNALMEAMALGLPCIATDCPTGGPKELIKNGENGLLINVGNKEQLVNNMINLSQNDKFSDKISANAKNIAVKLSIENISKQWIDFMSDIYKGGKYEKNV